MSSSSELTSQEIPYKIGTVDIKLTLTALSEPPIPRQYFYTDIHAPQSPPTPKATLSQADPGVSNHSHYFNGTRIDD
jgi:hypothetical protein